MRIDGETKKKKELVLHPLAGSRTLYSNEYRSFHTLFHFYHAVVLIAYLLSEIFYGCTMCRIRGYKEKKVVWRTEEILISCVMDGISLFRYLRIKRIRSNYETQCTADIVASWLKKEIFLSIIFLPSPHFWSWNFKGEKTKIERKEDRGVMGVRDLSVVAINGYTTAEESKKRKEKIHSSKVWRWQVLWKLCGMTLKFQKGWNNGRDSFNLTPSAFLVLYGFSMDDELHARVLKRDL